MVALFLPLIRKGQAKQVLLDLNNQTVKPDLLYIVDNSLNFEYNPSDFDYSIIYGKRKSNTGVNPCWNLMWEKQFSSYKYVGLIGDDYRLNKYCLVRMLTVLKNNPEVKVVTCHINRPCKILPPEPSGLGIKYSVCSVAKGHLGFCLFDREFLVNNVPPIPEELNVYFGDNWIGEHIHRAGQEIYQLEDTTITHYHFEDIATPLKLKEVLRKERGYWKTFIRGELENESDCSKGVQTD
jgi:hypothetical protein